MKVPPKRKGNVVGGGWLGVCLVSLNESPSEKEGKFRVFPRSVSRKNGPQ